MTHDLGAPLTGAELIAAKRARQTPEDGWAPGAEPSRDRQLIDAAQTYLVGARFNFQPGDYPPNGTHWPWRHEYWQPTGDTKQDLITAGAFIAAAIDALTVQAADEEG